MTAARAAAGEARAATRDAMREFRESERYRGVKEVRFSWLSARNYHKSSGIVDVYLLDI